MEFSPTCHWSQEEYFKFQETRIIDQRIFLGGLIKVGSFSGIKTMERFMVGKKYIRRVGGGVDHRAEWCDICKYLFF